MTSHTDLKPSNVKVPCIHKVLTPRSPNFGPFRFTTSRFRHIRLLKFVNALNDLRVTLKT